MTREEALEAIHHPGGLPEDPERRQALEAWLKSDAELQRAYEEQSALFAVLDEWDDPSPSQDFDIRLREAVEVQSTGTLWSRWLEPLWTPQWAAALLAVVIAAASFLASVPTSPIDDPATKTAIALPSNEAGYTDADYVDEWDRALDDLDMLTEFEALAPEAVEGKS